jgi:hypothetical protein
MPTDVDDAFAGLIEESTRARLAPAADLRQRGDRQARSRAVAGLAAVVLIVAGVALTGHLVNGRRPVTAAAGAAQIPDAAFLRQSDIPGARAPIRPTVAVWPEWCGWMGFYDPTGRTAQGVRSLTWDREGDTWGDFTVVNAIQVYSGRGAEDVMAAARAAVRGCAEEKLGSITYRNELLGSIGVGAESELIHTSASGQDGYIALVRVGPAVVMVGTDGVPGQMREITIRMAGQAAIRISEWRN